MRQWMTERVRVLLGTAAGLAALAACGGDRETGGMAGSADTTAAADNTVLSAAIAHTVDKL